MSRKQLKRKEEFSTMEREVISMSDSTGGSSSSTSRGEHSSV